MLVILRSQILLFPENVNGLMRTMGRGVPSRRPPFVQLLRRSLIDSSCNPRRRLHRPAIPPAWLMIAPPAALLPLPHWRKPSCHELRSTKTSKRTPLRAGKSSAAPFWGASRDRRPHRGRCGVDSAALGATSDGRGGNRSGGSLATAIESVEPTRHSGRCVYASGFV